MIVGVGLELVGIDLFRREIEQNGEGWEEDILTTAEIAYCRSKRSPYESYAARFAAKQAFLKAMRESVADRCSWHEVEVGREEGGRPFLTLHGETAARASGRGIARVHLSLTHSRDHAAAAVVLEA